MRKLLLMLGVLILFAGGVVALASLTTSNLKVEKIDDVYIFWKKVNSFSSDTLLQRKDTIINEINQLKNENPSLEDFKDYCRDYCLLGGEQDNNDYCIPDCMSIELDVFYQTKDIMIKDYNKELNWIKSIK